MSSIPDIPDRAAEDAAGELVLGLVRALAARARLLLLWAAVGGIATAGYVLTLPRNWTAQLSFAPQARRTGAGTAGLTSLAAQFGVAVPGGDPSQSPQFYSALIVGQRVLGALVDSQVPSPGGSVRLASLLGKEVGGPDSVVKRERAIRALRQRVGVAVDAKTGVVAVRLRMPSSAAAARVGELLIREVEEFNVNVRRTQARAERTFTQERIDASARELEAAEQAVQDFLSRNRDYRNSPALSFGYERLNRQLQLRQTVHTSLVQSLEQARIDEVRDTPTITIVEHPGPPAVPDSRRVPFVFLFGAATGLVVGIVALEWRSRRRTA